MTELNMTFVRSAKPGREAIFETFALSVTSASTRVLLDFLGEGTQTPVFLERDDADNFVQRLEHALKEDKYPTPGGAYLIEDHFDAMYEQLKAGCSAFIHTE
jgi:hypothetical protein